MSGTENMVKKLNKHQIAFEIIQDLLVSTALTFSALLVSNAKLSFGLVAKEICFAWVINMLIGFVVPEKRIGENLSCILKLGKPMSFLFQMLIIVLINVVGISLCLITKNVGLNERFLPAWLNLLPMLIGVGYITALVCFPITNWVVDSIFGKNPKV